MLLEQWHHSVVILLLMVAVRAAPGAEVRVAVVVDVEAVEAVVTDLHKYKVGDVLTLNQNYEVGLDLYRKGYLGIVMRLDPGLMYEMKMSDGEIIGWSENLLEPLMGLTCHG